MLRTHSRVLCLAASLGACLAWADEWPQFRGPSRIGLTSESNLPAEWGVDRNIQWKTPVPGRGWSSPIVWGGSVILTTAVENESGGTFRWEVHCYDFATGKLIWKQVAREGEPLIPTHTSNTHASETPVTDGERIFVYFGMMGLYCYDFDGRLLWRKDLGTYPMQSDWGTASSPVLDGDSLFLQIDNEEDSFLVALDPATGEERWRVEREEPSNWSTPVIWRNKIRTELVTTGERIRSYDPATSELLWEFTVGGGRRIGMPVFNEEFLYTGSENFQGSGGFMFAVRAGASGDITPAEGETASEGIVWSRPVIGPQMASPLLYEGLLYVLERRIGVVNCIDAATGELVYKERLPGAQAFWASPWAYDGKVFLLDDTGTTHVLQPGREFEILAQNSLGEEQYWSSAAISKGALLIRGTEHLYCIRQ